jgi:hypothetical protein
MTEMKKSYLALIALPAPSWLLEISAFFMRTETELILQIRYVPELLLNGGLKFKYHNIDDV